MTDHDENGGGLPPEDVSEIKALKKLGAMLPKGEGEWPKLSAECQEAQAKLEKVERRCNAKLYQSTEHQYRMFCAAHVNQEVMDAILDAATELKIRATRATSTALLIVKIYSGTLLEPATASQRAQALRGAAMKKIKPNKLARHLKKEGIAKLAKYFSENQALKADKSSLTSNTKEEVDQFNPKLDWGEVHRGVWDKALHKGRCVRVILKPDGVNSGRIKAIRVMSTSKKREGRHDA